MFDEEPAKTTGSGEGNSSTLSPNIYRTPINAGSVVLASLW